MSELDPVNDALERLEWQDAREEETPQSRLTAMTRRVALTGSHVDGPWNPPTSKWRPPEAPLP